MDKPTMPPVVTYTKGHDLSWKKAANCGPRAAKISADLTATVAGVGVVLLIFAVAMAAIGAFNYKHESGAKAMTTEQMASSDGLWVMEYPAGDDDCKKAVSDTLRYLTEGKARAVVYPDNCIMKPATVNGPYFTWDVQTIPPTREYDPERDGPYPVIQVHNSQSPGLKKQGRLIRPVTKPDAELAIWEVNIDGQVVVVHDPEEAWILEHRHSVPESGG